MIRKYVSIFRAHTHTLISAHPVCSVRRLLALSLLGVNGLAAWTPGTGSPTAAAGFVVDPSNRREVLAFFHTVHAASENYVAKMAWTGSVAGGSTGTTSAAFKEDVRRRINFYRALAGLPADITFDATQSAKEQEAALMFARNGALSHVPPTNWILYSANAAAAAGSSNIALGNYGPAAVDAYIRDDGSNNQIVGHRRWLQYSRASVMATGDVPFEGSYNCANAIWVTGGWRAAPAPQFVAWPNRGHVPIRLVPARWSLSYPGANFANANVAMTQGGVNVPLTVVSRTDNGAGDNTLVWTPVGLPNWISGDTPYHVAVTGMSGSGVPTSHSYVVTLFDPYVLGDSVTLSGSDSPAATGSTYHFNPIAQADAYELSVTTARAADWSEGAEDPSQQIAGATTGSYPLRQSEVVRSGGKAFHFAFADFNNQSFAIIRDFTPTAASKLQFHERCRFATTNSTLHAEISNNGGGSWTSIWQRGGVGLASNLWDSSFIGRSVSLTGYAGQILRLRFVLRSNGGGVVLSTSANDGFFIDDISVTSATETAGGATTQLAGSATAFTLNTATAGAPLAVGSIYSLRIRPNVGTRWFGFGTAMTVNPRPPTGFESWAATGFPSAVGEATDDPDGDGLMNGVEYAFGLNPTLANPASAIPQPVSIGNTLAVSFSPPGGVSGVVYGAQGSRNLRDWFPLIDSGSGGSHQFSINQAGEPQIFFRHAITVDP